MYRCIKVTIKVPIQLKIHKPNVTKIYVEEKHFPQANDQRNPENNKVGKLFFHNFLIIQ